MKITAVTVRRLKTIGNYNNIAIEATAVVEEAKHGPVRQRHEEMKAMHSLNMATGFDLMADLIDSLFEKHAKLIEEAHSRITAAARATRENDEALDKKISDLADRLSMVHVQAQGDAKIRAGVGSPGLPLPPDGPAVAASAPASPVEGGGGDRGSGEIEKAAQHRSEWRETASCEGLKPTIRLGEATIQWSEPNNPLHWADLEAGTIPPDSAWQPEDGTEPQPIARVPYRIRGWAEERIAELKDVLIQMDRHYEEDIPRELRGWIATRIAALDSEIGADTHLREKQQVKMADKKRRQTLTRPVIETNNTTAARHDELRRLFDWYCSHGYSNSNIIGRIEQRRREIARAATNVQNEGSR